MTIINLPFVKYYKSFAHTKAQIRVATLGDKFLTNVCACLGNHWHVSTIYEFPFPPIEVMGRNVSYEGDVYFEMSESTQDAKQYKMLVELDGKMGHSTKYAVEKDKIRNYMIFQKFQCQTVRFSTFDISGHKFKGRAKHKKSIEPLSDTEILTEMNMVKCMNLPIPKSKHWHDLLHKCLHDSIIDPI
jgi:hypothetical protein